MPTVTSIKPQKNGRRLNIYIDDEFSFGIDLENFVNVGLKVDQTLSENKVKEIIKKAEFQKTLDKLLRFATLRPRSEKEINNWLKKKKVHESLCDNLLKKLKLLKFLDDKKFAYWWVDQRINFRPKSKRVLSLELRNKGIDNEIVREVLEEANIDEEKIARELLEKKAYKWHALPRHRAGQKMSEYLAGKGFGWDTINSVVDALGKK
ncbi:MAG: RecX family transcriptional regulator [bacterium]|nr:RecX family transcriptional regulator [bacterium]MDZ4210020.1 RecX family transcriptional regulator [Candidatus Curtissbacteria bacterium]